MKETKPSGYWTKEHCFEEAIKYSSKKEFRTNCSSAYTIAWRNKWLDDYTWFKRPDMTMKWTYETCYNEALKYHTIKEFRENNDSCYVTAWKKGWLKDYTWLEYADGKYIIWTKEECYKEAKKYKTLYDFRNNNCSAYGAALKNDWLKDYTWLERQVSEPYTLEYFKEVLKKYKTLKEFRKNENGLYSAAKKNKWLDIDEFKALTRLNKPNGYWNKERCAEEAAKYETLVDFFNDSPSAYSSAWKNKWLEEITTHMKTRVVPEDEYRQNYVIYVYKDELNHYIYVGLTNNIHIRDVSHRDINKNDTLYKHFAKYNLEIPEPEIVCFDLTPHEAQKKEREIYYQYKNSGWNMINCEKTLGSLGSTRKRWTYNKCYKEAEKYIYPVDFKNSSPGAYAAACRNRWLEDYTWLIRRRTNKKKDCK